MTVFRRHKESQVNAVIKYSSPTARLQRDYVLVS
jgi:hypothetical protein